MTISALVEFAHTHLPVEWRDEAVQLLSDNQFTGLNAPQLARLQQISGLSQHDLIIQLLPIAAQRALAPISHFYVGAIALGISGKLYFGANREFAGMPLGTAIHAEQSAITHAWMKGEQKLHSLTINAPPCGHCRQFMNELNSSQQLTLFLPDMPAVPLHSFLPHHFGPAALGVETGLMDKQDHGFSLDTHDPLHTEALAALNRSHAPYSRAYSGVALECRDGTQVSGSYAENAAFNPSLPPLQAALIMLDVAGKSLTDVKRAVLIERAQAPLHQWDSAQNLFISQGGQNMQRILLPD